MGRKLVWEKVGINSVVRKGFCEGNVKLQRMSLILNDAGSLWLVGAELSDESQVQGRPVSLMRRVARSGLPVSFLYLRRCSMTLHFRIMIF